MNQVERVAPLVEQQPHQAQRFFDRSEAGKLLAKRLSAYADRPDVVVIGLPRGGVPVAREVADALHAPLDVVVVRKLGAPWQPELALGAIASGGIRVLNDETIQFWDIAPQDIDALTAYELDELARRERLYRAGRLPLQVRGKTVIIVDDGLATGMTMRVAVLAVNKAQPGAIVVAAPVAATQTYLELRAMPEVSRCICLRTPRDFQAVGLWYDHFEQVSDDDVRAALKGHGNAKGSNLILLG